MTLVCLCLQVSSSDMKNGPSIFKWRVRKSLNSSYICGLLFCNSCKRSHIFLAQTWLPPTRTHFHLRPSPSSSSSSLSCSPVFWDFDLNSSRFCRVKFRANIASWFPLNYSNVASKSCSVLERCKGRRSSVKCTSEKGRHVTNSWSTTWSISFLVLSFSEKLLRFICSMFCFSIGEKGKFTEE